MNLTFFQKRPWLLAAAVLLIVVVLFGIYWQSNPASPVNDAAVTQAHFTVSARLTEAVKATRTGAANSSQTPTSAAQAPAEDATTTPEPVDPTRSVPDQAVQATASPTLSCDRAAPGIPMDITVPDDTQFRPGETFTKVWRLQNIGTCTWTGDYAARFFYGDLMSASEVVFLGREVATGDNVDIAVDMVAPNDPGNYQGNWKLINGRGQLFGIGPKGDAPFWVRIVVERVATQTSTPTITPTPTLTATLPVTPTATPTATPPVQSSGDLSLQIPQSVDLDSGERDPLDGKDLDYRLENSFHVLIPQNEAVLGVYGVTQPGLEMCQSAALSKAPLALESLSPGIHLCYRTDVGRYGWLRYVSLNENGSTDLVYLTWAIP